MRPLVVALCTLAALISHAADALDDGRVHPVFVTRVEPSMNFTASLDPFTERQSNHHMIHHEVDSPSGHVPEVKSLGDMKRMQMDQRHHINHPNGRKLDKIIFRVLVRKYAKECKLSKGSSKRLMKIFEENPPKIPKKDEDRSQWTEEQWRQEARREAEYMQRIRNLAFERIDEHKALTLFFTKLEEHEVRMKQDIERETRHDLHRLAKRSKLNDIEFNRFMRIRELNKAKIHWRINMHPNEVKKAENMMADSWKKTKKQALNGTVPEEREHMELFLADVEATWKKTQQTLASQHNKRHQVKEMFSKILHRRRQLHTKEMPEQDGVHP